MKKIDFSLDFLTFWLDSTKRGSKEKAFYAFRERVKTHSIEDINNAYKIMLIEKKGKEDGFMPHISTFLNSLFDGYHERASQENVGVTNVKYPDYILSAAERLDIDPASLPWKGSNLFAQFKQVLDIPTQEEAREMLSDIKKLTTGRLTLNEYYDKWEVPIELQRPEFREVPF